MTIKDILVQVIAETSEKSAEENIALAEQVFSVIGTKANIDDDLPETEAVEFCAMLRQTLPLVRKKLMERYFDTHTDFLGGYDDQVH